MSQRRLLLGALEGDLEGREFEQYAGMDRGAARRYVAGEHEDRGEPVRGGRRMSDDVTKRRLAIGALEDDMSDARLVSLLGITRKEARDYAVGELDY